MVTAALPRSILLQFLVKRRWCCRSPEVSSGWRSASAPPPGWRRSSKWPITIQVDVITIRVIFSAFVGIVFGLYPARLLSSTRSTRCDTSDARHGRPRSTRTITSGTTAAQRRAFTRRRGGEALRRRRELHRGWQHPLETVLDVQGGRRSLGRLVREAPPEGHGIVYRVQARRGSEEIRNTSSATSRKWRDRDAFEPRRLAGATAPVPRRRGLREGDRGTPP